MLFSRLVTVTVLTRSLDESPNSSKTLSKLCFLSSLSVLLIIRFMFVVTVALSLSNHSA
ncbi:MAG: hypothetical protein J6C62_06655 [Clostridia bacterium]|nr:hypothetical protein [Clostridia bacterium]